MKVLHRLDSTIGYHQELNFHIRSNYIGKNGRFANQMFQYALRHCCHNYDICVPSGPKTEDEFIDEEISINFSWHLI